MCVTALIIRLTLVQLNKIKALLSVVTVHKYATVLCDVLYVIMNHHIQLHQHTYSGKKGCKSPLT